MFGSTPGMGCFELSYSDNKLTVTKESTQSIKSTGQSECSFKIYKGRVFSVESNKETGVFVYEGNKWGKFI